MGVALSEPGGRMDEHLDAMRALGRCRSRTTTGGSSTSPASTHSRDPSKPAGPPIIIGGDSARARRRRDRQGTRLVLLQHHHRAGARGRSADRRRAKAVRASCGARPARDHHDNNGPFDRSVADQYGALGVDRLVLLPRPDAPAGRRHEPVPFDDILRTIDRTANMIRTP